jgi:hypothetical protein
VFFGLDLQELQTFRERVNSVTVDDVQRVARTYLHPDRLSIVLVGDASKFEKQLAAAGFDQYEKISVNDLDLSSPTLRRQRTGAGRITPASFQAAKTGRPAVAADEARTLIDRAVRAKGGLERLKTIRTVQAVSDTVIEVEGRKVTVPTTIRVRYPGSFRVDSDMPAGRLTQVFDSGTFWIQDARGASVAPPGAAEAMRGNVQRDSIALLLALADGRVKARRGGDVTVDGRALPVLDVDVKPGGPLTLVFDPASGLILRQRYPAGSSAGSVEETFSDYRDVDGLKVAFAVNVRQPQGEVTRVLRQFAINVALAPGLFTRPG